MLDSVCNDLNGKVPWMLNIIYGTINANKELWSHFCLNKPQYVAAY